MSADRGQTMLDFVVAIGLFLLTIAFVVAFVPHLTAPYGHQDQPAVAERAASELSANLLAGEAPSVLEEACTVAFLTSTGGSACPFDTADPLTTRLGVGDRYRVNVTLERNVTGDAATEVLCANGGSIGACGSGRLAAGPDVPADRRSLARSRRAVSVDGIDAVLEVTVW